MLIDELNSVLNYIVRIQHIFKQGNVALRTKQKIEFTQMGSCQSPDLKEQQDYLFMWQGKTGNFLLDQTSFVKLWPREPQNNKDKSIGINLPTNFLAEEQLLWVAQER